MHESLWKYRGKRYVEKHKLRFVFQNWNQVRYLIGNRRNRKFVFRSQEVS